MLQSVQLLTPQPENQSFNKLNQLTITHNDAIQLTPLFEPKQAPGGGVYDKVGNEFPLTPMKWPSANNPSSINHSSPYMAMVTKLLSTPDLAANDKCKNTIHMKELAEQNNNLKTSERYVSDQSQYCTIEDENKTGNKLISPTK